MSIQVSSPKVGSLVPAPCEAHRCCADAADVLGAWVLEAFMGFPVVVMELFSSVVLYNFWSSSVAFRSSWSFLWFCRIFGLLQSLGSPICGLIGGVLLLDISGPCQDACFSRFCLWDFWMVSRQSVGGFGDFGLLVSSGLGCQKL